MSVCYFVYGVDFMGSLFAFLKSVTKFIKYRQQVTMDLVVLPLLIICVLVLVLVSFHFWFSLCSFS